MASRHRAALITVLSIAMAAFALVALAAANQPSDLDSFDAQEHLQARECAESGMCQSHFLPSTVPPLWNGAVYIDVLTAIRFFGGNIAHVRWIILWFTVWVLFVGQMALSRLFSPTTALSISLLTLAGLIAVPLQYQVADTSHMFAPAAMGFLLLVVFACSGDWRALLLASVFVSLACNTHVTAYCLLAPLLAVAVTGDHPGKSVALAAAAYGATSVITSYDAIVMTLRGSYLTDFGAAGSLALYVGGAWVARAAFLRLGTVARAAVVGVAALVPFLIGYLVLRFGLHNYLRPAPGFLQAILFPIAVTVGTGLALLEARITAALRMNRLPPVLSLAAALAAVVVLPGAVAGEDLEWHKRPAGERPLSVEDALRISRHLASQGWAFPAIADRLRGPGCDDLLAGLAVSFPRQKEALPEDIALSPDVVRRAAASSLPAGADVIPLDADWAFVARPFRSWIKASDDVACISGVDGSGALCRSALPVGDSASLPFADWMFPRTGRFDFGMRAAPSQRKILTHSVALRPRAGEVRDISLAPGNFDGCLSIVAASGVSVETTLPAKRVRLRSADGAPARLQLSSADQPECVLPQYRDAPCFIESDPATAGAGP